jgi:DNA-binding Lrp family transcriptional regulator
MQNHVEEKYKISRDTTRKLVDLMERRGIVKISKPERAGMPHYLSINEDNQFNQIFEAFTAIDHIIDNMQEPLTKFWKLVTQHINQHKSNHSGPELGPNCRDCVMHRNLMMGFLVDYADTVIMTLDVLIVRVRESLITSEDRVRLYDNILNIKLKCFKQIGVLYNVYHQGNNLYVSLTNECKEYIKRQGISFDTILTKFKELGNSKILNADGYTAYFDPRKLTVRVEYQLKANKNESKVLE